MAGGCGPDGRGGGALPPGRVTRPRLVLAVEEGAALPLGVLVHLLVVERVGHDAVRLREEAGLQGLPGGEGLRGEDGLKVGGPHPGLHQLPEPGQLVASLLAVAGQVVRPEPATQISNSFLLSYYGSTAETMHEMLKEQEMFEDCGLTKPRQSQLIQDRNNEYSGIACSSRILAKSSQR